MSRERLLHGGGYSQINSELLLLKKATQNGYYQHYHLLSGSDLPIKSQDDISSFFNRHKNKEFVRFEKNNFEYEDRTRYYYPFQEIVGRTHNIFLKVWSLLFLYAQKALHIHRNREVLFQKGTNWFSITDDFARYVVQREVWIKKVFKNSFCCDEVFLQTLLIHSEFIDSLYHSAFDNNPHATMRLIDWTRGKPYIFRYSDLNELLKSDMMFARKFDPDIDYEIIQSIYERFS